MNSNKGKKENSRKRNQRSGAAAEHGASGTQMCSRNEVPAAWRWNLKRLFVSNAAWEREFADWSREIETFAAYRGTFGDVSGLVKFLEAESAFHRRGERLAAYAFLRSVEDLTDSDRRSMKDRLYLAFARAGEAASFVRPELLAVSASIRKTFLTDKKLSRWRRKLEEIFRFKPHTLSAKEERLIAQTADVRRTASNAFRLLTDADMTFGQVKDEHGTMRPLTNESLSIFLHSPKRSVRRGAFEQFYQAFDSHKNTLSATLEGSIQNDIFSARARRYPDAMSASLFAENITPAVYENLISAVHETLPALYRYYDLRRRAMKLADIHFYDTYVPIRAGETTRRDWDEAVELIAEALRPLGSEYVATLRRGLTVERWVDRYENAGKQSGAFSLPGYDFPPFIMTNYKPELLESVFTLAHEAGHSMHSLLSAKKQSYENYDYEIFLAEIASTFNEQLLSDYLLAHSTDRASRLRLILREIDAMRATIFRQTMFSEFERDAHRAAEAREPLTVDRFRAIYRRLLEKYFGPHFTLDPQLELECLRIPHFYRAFYVYKYATGMSAAITLAERVAEGAEAERLDYFRLLEGGCSAPPLAILRSSGVDMEKPDALQNAMNRFTRRVDELEALLKS